MRTDIRKTSNHKCTNCQAAGRSGEVANVQLLGCPYHKEKSTYEQADGDYKSIIETESCFNSEVGNIMKSNEQSLMPLLNPWCGKINMINHLFTIV